MFKSPSSVGLPLVELAVIVYLHLWRYYSRCVHRACVFSTAGVAWDLVESDDNQPPGKGVRDTAKDEMGRSVKYSKERRNDEYLSTLWSDHSNKKIMIMPGT